MPESTPLDATLETVLRGDADAFLGVIRAYGPGLRAFLSSQLFQLDAVDDVSQETFIAAYRSLHSFRRGDDFGAWLRGIARNKLKRYFEQTSRRADLLETFRLESSVLLEGVFEEAAGRTKAEHLQTMLGCIGKLSERMRRVIHASLEGQRCALLAEEMGTTPGAIYQLQYRALQILRECVTKEMAHGS